MRTIVAAVASSSMLVVGVFALSQASQQAAPAAQNSSNDTQAALETANQVFGGFIEAAGPGVVWMGIAAVVLVSLGMLVATAGGGR